MNYKITQVFIIFILSFVLSCNTTPDQKGGNPSMRKLSVKETMIKGMDPNFKMDFPVKDTLGNILTEKQQMEIKSREVVFLEMYVNQNDKIVEAVVKQMTPELMEEMKVIQKELMNRTN
ncbi:MAG: hypothetical protein M3Q56_00680 [Bacteroidota bacterium]|nr:hypothetical protein [Bacteroidota bacterium]